ncbi:MAG: ATP phosphoribosyltransferase regulatory subunit, partial [Bdellovibrionia bacterium]
DSHLSTLNSQLSDLALRYDLTVPLARVVANHKNDLPKFFKRYQIQPVWRADRPARGRFREFYQCDVDAIGSSSMVVEAELISAVCEILTRLGFEDFSIRLNHRLFLASILDAAGLSRSRHTEALIALDKIDKIGRKGVEQEFKQRGMSEETSQKLLGFFEFFMQDTTSAEILTHEEMQQLISLQKILDLDEKLVQQYGPVLRELFDPTRRSFVDMASASAAVKFLASDSKAVGELKAALADFDKRYGGKEKGSEEKTGSRERSEEPDWTELQRDLRVWEKGTVLVKVLEFTGNSDLSIIGGNSLAGILRGLDDNPALSRVRIDPSLVRGLSYYTGTIMEISVPDLAGSLGGGGRYDGLIGMFGKEQIPACGFSLGLERILVVMEERGMFPPEIADSTPADVMVTIWSDETVAESLKLASELRANGLRVTVYPEADKEDKQWKYANAIRVPWICTVNDKDIEVGMVSFQNLRTRDRYREPIDTVAAKIKQSA